MWPFKKTESEVLPGVKLDAEEQKEVRGLWESVIESQESQNGGTLWMKKEYVESFRRGIAALSLMGRAERFLILGGSEPEYRRKACEAAAKACAIFPVSIYFYDFACILQEFGKQADARTMFAEFLRRFATEELGHVEQMAMRDRDLDEAVARARRELARKI